MSDMTGSDLVEVDHARTENFLAFDAGGDILVATAMLAAEPSLDRAEVAIATRSDFKNRGVGWTMLEYVSDHATAKGIKTLESIECRDNRSAINLEQEMGFTHQPLPRRSDPRACCEKSRLSDEIARSLFRTPACHRNCSRATPLAARTDHRHRLYRKRAYPRFIRGARTPEANGLYQPRTGSMVKQSGSLVKPGRLPRALHRRLGQGLRTNQFR